jgi:hypothetical protein
MVGIVSWRSLLRNTSSPAWCDDLEGVTKELMVDFWPDDCPEEFRAVQEYALNLIPLYLAHYALKVLNNESRWYRKDLSLLGNKGFCDAYNAAILSQTSVEDGFEEPEDTLIADVLATAKKRNLRTAEKQLGRLKGEVDEVMERLNVQKALDEKDAFNDSEQLDISPVVSSGSSSVLSPSTTVTEDRPKTSESLPEGMTDVPCVRKDERTMWHTRIGHHRRLECTYKVFGGTLLQELLFGKSTCRR